MPLKRVGWLMSIEWVSSQIAEILQSDATSPPILEKKLVVSPFHTGFVGRTTFIGRIWVILWGMSRIIDWWGHLEKKAFAASLQKTAELWREYMTLFARNTRITEKMASAALQGTSYLGKNERQTALNVTLLARLYIVPLFQNYGTGSPEDKWTRVCNLLATSSLVPLSSLNLGFLSWFQELFPTTPDPTTLKKILDKEPLEPRQQIAFDAFIRQIKEKENSIPMGDFLRALETLVMQMRQEKQLFLLLWELDKALRKIECRLFDKIDPFHAKEVKKYQKIHPEAFLREGLLFIPGEKSMTMLSPVNRAALYLLKAEAQYGSWQRHLLPVEIEESGFQAKVPLFEAARDLIVMAPLLSSLVQKARWCPSLSLDHAVITGGICKLLRPLPLIEDPFAYDTALSFMKDHAQNPAELVETIQKSGLLSHPLAQFYRFISHKELSRLEKAALVERVGLHKDLTDACIERAEKVRLVLEEVMDSVFSSLKIEPAQRVKAEALRKLLTRSLLTGEGIFPAFDERLLVCLSFTQELQATARLLLLRLDTLRMPSEDELHDVDKSKSDGTCSLRTIIHLLTRLPEPTLLQVSLRSLTGSQNNPYALMAVHFTKAFVK